ncbi:MAG TPA: peptidoglycan recognition family protein, partial [Dehalococcoidia bacterium]|nr:peptidoglycan recognition family protein [Dehalococcoidia bacterium]
MFLPRLLEKRVLVGVLLDALGVAALILAQFWQTAYSTQSPGKTVSSSWTESSLVLTPQSDLGTFSQAYSAPESGRFAQAFPAQGEACLLLPLALQPEYTYQYVSPVKEAPLPFNALGFHWDAEVPPDAHVAIEARTSQDGNEWGSWLPTEEVDALQGSRPQDTDLLFSSGRFLQYRVTVRRAPETWGPVFDAVRVTFINSSQGPSAEDAVAASGPFYRLAALIRPQPLARQAWGANETIRFNQGDMVWPLGYAPVKKIVLHHTATSNEYTDSAAIVRAIYYYHTVTLGWGDIGYNFVIDAAGKVYEGRYGGSNVIGAHVLNRNPGTLGVALIGTFSNVDPPAEAVKAIDRFLVAKAVEYGIDPVGRSVFMGEDLPNIMGHRDVNSTSCPGDKLYALIPSLRDRAQAALPAYGESWASDNTPKLLKPGQEITVEVQALNSGTA